MTAVMGYLLLVSTSVVAIAYLLEQIACAVRWPRRAIWILSLAACILVPSVMILWAARPPITVQSASVKTPAPQRVLRATTERTVAAPIQVRLWFDRAALDSALTLVWAAACILFLLVYAAMSVGLARWSSRWQPRWIDRDFVWISAQDGPAVVGVLDPQIVVPEWFARLPRRVRQIVLEHERQHIAARDPLLWHLGFLIVALLPWNPLMWWQLRRLRLAQEIDCDSRVLRSGCDSDFYARSLLNIAQRHRQWSWAAVSWGNSRSQLEKRIEALLIDRRRSYLTWLALMLVATSLAGAAASFRAPTMPQGFRTATQIPIATPVLPTFIANPRGTVAPWHITAWELMPEVQIVSKAPRGVLLNVGLDTRTLPPEAMQERMFQISAGSALETLHEFALQAGMQVSADYDQLSLARTRAVSGVMSGQEALTRMLEGTGLRFSQAGERRYSISAEQRHSAKSND
jgi:bla regulator protein BlaR1